MPTFQDQIAAVNPCFCKMDDLRTLQVNLGNFCNLNCTHCHQQASPTGSHFMARVVMERITAFLDAHRGLTLDITGGAPEMHPDFRSFIEMTSGFTRERLLRSNLAIMAEPAYTWLPEFCRAQDLSIVASLPCYLEENVDKQRGRGVFNKLIKVIRELNRLGYGRELELNLVYNPGGPFLPPSQMELEESYREQLAGHGVVFSRLFTITNAPLGRFRNDLEMKGKLAQYKELLQSSFNATTAEGIMCRSLVSVDWQGLVYNCDFNQGLDLQATDEKGEPLSIFNLDDNANSGMKIRFADHCYCCTAGEGSSCTGALAATKV